MISFVEEKMELTKDGAEDDTGEILELMFSWWWAELSNGTMEQNWYILSGEKEKWEVVFLCSQETGAQWISHWTCLLL